MGGKVDIVVDAKPGVDLPGQGRVVGAGVACNAIAGHSSQNARLKIGDKAGFVEGAVVGRGGAGVEGAGVIAFFDDVGELEAVLEKAEVAEGGRGVGEGGGVEDDACLNERCGDRWSDGALPVEAAGGQAGRGKQEREDAGVEAHARVAIVAGQAGCSGMGRLGTVWFTAAAQEAVAAR